jgi:hypothetical protein
MGFFRSLGARRGKRLLDDQPRAAALEAAARQQRRLCVARRFRRGGRRLRIGRGSWFASIGGARRHGDLRQWPGPEALQLLQVLRSI